MLNQINLITAVCNELEKQGVSSDMVPRQFNAVIRAVNSIIAEMEKKPVFTTPGMGLQAWLDSDDTGLSSLYMASVLGDFSRPYAHPADIGDFARCLRLLKAVPEFAAKVHLMRDKSEQWAKLVDSWDAIESMMKMDASRANTMVRAAVE